MKCEIRDPDGNIVAESDEAGKFDPPLTLEPGTYLMGPVESPTLIVLDADLQLRTTRDHWAL